MDPRDPEHLYVGLSGSGSFESVSGGASWRALNRGVSAHFLPDKEPEIGQDPHVMALHPLKPDRLYQQNHCGIYRLDRPGDVEAAGTTVAEVSADPDRRFPGVRFRIVEEQDQVRQHMGIYIGPEPAATLEQRIPAGQEIHILQALSG